MVVFSTVRESQGKPKSKYKSNQLINGGVPEDALSNDCFPQHMAATHQRSS